MDENASAPNRRTQKFERDALREAQMEEWPECAKCGAKLDINDECPICDNLDLPKDA